MLSFLIPTCVLILSGLVAWYFVAKRSPFVGNGPIKLVQIVPVSQKSRVLVMEFGEKQLVLGETGSHMTLLTERAITDDCSERVNEQLSQNVQLSKGAGHL